MAGEVARGDIKAKATAPACYFFPPDTAPAADYDYDPLALIFFCISRYEEYQTGEQDEHGRFTAGQSHALRHAYLERPVVNDQLLDLARRLKKLFPECALELPPYELRLTYDVDIPYAYRGRGWRGWASGLKDLLTGHPERTIDRFRTLLNPAQSDPYDVFDWLAILHQKYGMRPRFFWLLAQEKSRFDPNPAPDNPQLRELIQRVGQRADIGIHPSYRSIDNPRLFSSERASLAKISGQYIEHSRQHFLRFQLPVTYRQLLKAGLRHDHSMGYADHVGFRAGTNLSFYWYDLEREERTYLRIHPFAAMDVSLRRYHDLCYFASQKKILELAQCVRTTGGPFTLLWHNSSFAAAYGWQGWREMYAELVEVLAVK